MSERDAIERAARVAEDIARKWQVKARDYPYHGEPTGWSIAAAIRALPPAEPEEVSEAMIEAGAEALWDTFRQTEKPRRGMISWWWREPLKRRLYKLVSGAWKREHPSSPCALPDLPPTRKGGA